MKSRNLIQQLVQSFKNDAQKIKIELEEISQEVDEEIKVETKKKQND